MSLTLETLTTAEASAVNLPARSFSDPGPAGLGAGVPLAAPAPFSTPKMTEASVSS
jgi:hypothetical protein